MENTKASSSNVGIDSSELNCDVYLSFRREDTRNSFVDVLYEFMKDSGIHAFRDDTSLHFGIGIGDKFKRAINCSKIFVIVFSRNYARSIWCLQELAMIMANQRLPATRKLIVPVFYDVGPDDVRLSTDIYRRDMDNHRRLLGDERVHELEEALVEASSLSGFSFKDFQSEGMFARQIVKSIRVRATGLYESEFAAENQVEEVMKLVDIGPMEVRLVVVHGIRGIGKTTLAKVVFNRISQYFDEASFISNVRESSKTYDGIMALRKRLLHDIHGIILYDSSCRITPNKSTLRSKRVMIILDDVDNINQIETLAGCCDWFAFELGSRIIVTARNINIASDLMRSQAGRNITRACVYEMKEMSDAHALELFHRHAFGFDVPSLDFMDLSKELVKFTGNTPLALSVLGAYLHGRSISSWVNALEKLKREFHSTQGPKKFLEGLIESSVPGEAEEDIEVSDIMEEIDAEHFADPDLSLKQTQLAAISHIIGIDHQVSDLIESANRGSDGVLMTGICHTTKTSRGSSPRGVGLTTFANAVYSRVSSQFDACCFLEDIAEAIAPPGGIRPLQFKLIHDILGVEYEDKTSYEEAFEVFKEVLHQMKVLIVLDGVEDISHITNFIGKELKSCLGLGSCIIVTSRGNNVITETLGADLVIYKSINLMERKVAVELFNWHAFGKEHCETECSEFVEPIVCKLPGCPLLIEFSSSLLHGEDVQAFEKFSKLQLTSDFWEVLAVLHGELDGMQKQIFLDVACFAANEDVQTAKYMWHEWLRRYSGKIMMPFAKVVADDRLWMHSSLRHFGRKLMDEKKNSGISSHVYDHQSAMDMLKNERGTESIEALCLGFDGKAFEEFTEENFRRMSEIRFLRLDSAVITGDFKDVFRKLRWLQWRRCCSDFEATNVDTEGLLILDLSGSAITGDWKGWENITLINVKVLNLSGCLDILLTPNFSISPKLERLILEGCPRLVHIDPSICTLKHLVYLNLRSCQELNILPQELGELVALRELLIDGTGVEEIPDIGELLNLEILSCLGCIRLRRLPDSIGKLKRLQKLSIRDCRRVQQLPQSFGEMDDSSLVELDISGTGIAELKNTISKFPSLKVLRMDSCFISELPITIELLTSLEELHASCCRNLKEIPPQIGELKNLRILELRHASISGLPAELSKLDKLEMLDLSHCDKLKQPPELPLKAVCTWSRN